jgi:uncharacterized membrane protein YedE/YeeE
VDVTGLSESLWLALGLGLGFGFFLERAGLGSSVKLAAQFYLTDLAVFKVMFTAIVTALVGLAALSATGVVDPARIELPGTFLLPQLVGGLVFGVGFVVGGYCPGTGCVGLASGRLDAVAVIAGMLAGSFAFAEAYPLLATFYQATPLGPVTLPELAGIPGWAGTLAVVALAAGGFALAERIERRHVLPSPGSPEAP